MRGRVHFSLAHEIGHWCLHRGYVAYQRLRAAHKAGTATTATTTQASSPMIASTPKDDSARLAAGTNDA